MTSKLLLEAGMGYARSNYPLYSDAKGNVLPTDISIFDQALGIQYNAVTTYASVNHPPRASQRASVSYVTGTHAFKAGVQLEELANDRTTEVHGNVNYTFNNRVPVSLTQYATPYFIQNRDYDFGFYGQDQWTINRLTLNYGLRYRTSGAVFPPSTWMPRPMAGSRRAISRP